jgi:hypothetical protein
MQYFSLPQIILIIFFGLTNILGITSALKSDLNNDAPFIKFFWVWCVYIVISLGVYFYLGTI